MGLYKTSRYNFHFPTNAGALVYNSLTGNSQLFTGEESEALAEAISTYPADVESDDIPENLLLSFKQYGFLVKHECSELEIVRKRFNFARKHAAVALTVTLTQDCNLGCYYCYQDREGEYLRNNDVAPLIERAKELLSNSSNKKLHVDWYGGEPMLNVEVLEEASIKLQELCGNLGVSYEASMLSNGTMWPKNKLSFVQRHKLVRLQVSFDGSEKKHNKTRRKRKEFAESTDNQFKEAVGVVDDLKSHIWVDVRLNISPLNFDDATEFARFGKSRGWFDEPSKAKLQLAKITSYTDRIDFLRENSIDYDVFESTRDKIRLIVDDSYLDTTSSLKEYPKPRKSVCSAIADNSIVVGAEGNLYNCGLQIGDTKRAVGRLHNSYLSERRVFWLDSGKTSKGTDSYVEQGEDKEFWNNFNPADMPKCRDCSFLPLCWGACPKLHLENDQMHLDQQSEYWRRMLPLRLSAATGYEISPEFRLTDREQFR